MKKAEKVPVSQGFEPSPADISAEEKALSPEMPSDKKPSPPLRHTWPPKDLLEEPAPPPVPERPRLNIVIGDDGIDRKI